jgi:hypothetical protein
MASNLGSLAVYLTANTSQFESALTSAQRTLSGFGKSILAIAGVTGLGAFAKQSIDAYKSQIQEEKRLGAVLAATGNAAGLTKQNMKDYAGELKNLTGIDDDVILHTETMLSTFKNIRGDTFKRVTVAAYDMAEVLGTDASGAAMKLGRMLNNPAEGLSALSRVGITFNDQQKKQIELMQQSGDMLGAQNFILKELEGRFGGTAAAMNTGGKQMKRAFEDLQKAIGHSLVEIAGITSDAKGGLTYWLQDTAEKIDKTAFEFGFAFQSMAIEAKYSALQIAGIFEAMYSSFSIGLDNLSDKTKWLINLIPSGLQTAWDFIKAFFTDVKELSQNVFSAMATYLKSGLTDPSGWDYVEGRFGSALKFQKKKFEEEMKMPEISASGSFNFKLDEMLKNTNAAKDAELKALTDVAAKRKMLEAEKNNKEQTQARKAKDNPYDLGMEAQKGVEQKVSMALVRGTMEAYKAEAQAKHDATMVTLTQQIAKNTQKMADSKNTTINVKLETVNAFGG